MQEVVYTIEDLRMKIAVEKEALLRGVETYFDLPDLNIIWELVAGIRYVFLSWRKKCSSLAQP